MILRAYTKEDSPVIAKWIRSETELYQWSASHFGFFPLLPCSIDEHYAPSLKTGRFIPLTGVDDGGKPVAHLFIKYPNENDDSLVRFGFVVVDPEMRGKGYGRELIRLAIDYVRNNLSATRISLGVFENNPNANHLYKTMGFRAYAQRKVEMPVGTWNCIDMELFLNKE